jgi:hypothetical protein
MYINSSTRRSREQHIVFKHNSEAQNSSATYLEIHLQSHRHAESSQYKGRPVRVA